MTRQELGSMIVIVLILWYVREVERPLVDILFDHLPRLFQ
jgi:hypothetical protein